VHWNEAVPIRLLLLLLAPGALFPRLFMVNATRPGFTLYLRQTTQLWLSGVNVTVYTNLEG
jgi:hypothetical protein